MKSTILISFTFIITLFSFSSLRAQDSLIFIKKYVMINPFQILWGEAVVAFGYSHRQDCLLEGYLGYVYKEYYDRNTDNWEIVRSKTKGFLIGAGYKISRNTSSLKDYYYFQPYFSYKYVRKDSIVKEYMQAADGGEHTKDDAFWFPYEDKICDYCSTVETDSKHVLSFRVNWGKMNRSSRIFVYDLYWGVGLQLKIINLRIHELNDFNIMYKFHFDDYRIRIYQGYPIVYAGIKIGFLFQ